MFITYLGTAAAEGAPAVFCECEHCRYARITGGKEIRMRSGALIDGKLKIDFGPDAYAQSLRFGISYVPVNHVLITHSHSDHFAVNDLKCIRPPYSHREQPLHVYGDKKVEDMIQPHLSEYLLFTRVEPFTTYYIDGYSVTPLEAVHALNQGEEPLFYLIEKDGKRLLYMHDTDLPTEADMAFLKGRRMDLISMDCTNGILNPDYIGHMGIEDNLKLREMLIENGTADENTAFVANHFSHNGLVPHEEMEKRLPGFTVTYDGLTLMV